MAVIKERRKYPRVENHFTLRYRSLKGNNIEYRGTISKNISESGIRFRSDRFIPLACRLLLELDVPALQKPVRAVSRIAWIRKLPTGSDYEMGNHFLEISKDDRNLIRDLVTKELNNNTPPKS